MIAETDNFKITSQGTGTKEWADVNYNIGKGCSHGCLYCYAGGMAYHFKRIATREAWKEEFLVKKQVNKKLGKQFTDKVIMFPSSHDITPAYLNSALQIIQKLLNNGNSLLIVSKPHLECIKKICDNFSGYKERILFRFTIGSLDEAICKFWEPGAPPPAERIEALKYAFKNGFSTSVSCEPMLKGIDDICKVVNAIESYVTDKIWIGKMNMAGKYVDMSIAQNATAVTNIKNLQSDTKILQMVAKLKNNHKIEWKDSIQKVIKKHNSN